ncbi:hypothetical protein JCM5350_005928 [Sporobolomyces pararoseus]
MSFSQLPNETIQLIVDKCAEADRAYNDRKGEQKIKEESQGEKGLWKGRSRMAISLVNRGLRNMAIKHIFKTFPIVKVDDHFVDTILDPPTANRITELDFGDLNATILSTSTWRQIFLIICPRLPNIRTIKNFNSYHLWALCPREVGVDEFDEELRARKAFLELADKIEDWDVQIGVEKFETIANVNPAGIKRLHLSSPCLFSPKSRFPSLLAKLPNLQSLKIRQKVMSSDDDDDDIDYLDESHFQIPFQFANSLRSLDFHYSNDEYDEEDTITVDLKFASLFPLLEKLVLNANDRNPWETHGKNTFKFPHLRHLEIKGLHIECLHYLLDDLDIPRIEEIHFNYLSSDSYQSSQAKFHLTLPLHHYQSTLRKVKISNSLYDEELDSLLPAIFSETLPSVILELDSPTRLALNPISLDEYRNDCIPSVDVPVSSADPFYEETTELLDWARSKAELWRDGDLKMGRELTKASRLVKDMKEWLEE